MKTKLLIMTIAAATLVGCGAYTSERIDATEPPKDIEFETPFWREHNMGSNAPTQKLADIRDSTISPITDGLQETGFGGGLIRHHISS